MPQRSWLVAAALWAFLAGPAAAQPASNSPERLHATVVSVSGDMMMVRTEDDETVAVALPPGVRFGALSERSLADIRPGDFVGSAAVRGRDGKLHAQEVHIFPDSLRGAGEGHRPMDQPGQTMTNATVDGVADGAVTTGRTLRLRYPGGEQSIEVGPEVRVVGLIPGDRSLLVPGAAVTVRATRTADEALTAVSVQVEKDGVKPLP